MNMKIKLYQLLLLVIIVTFLLRAEYVWNGIVLFTNIIIALFINTNIIYKKMNIYIFDYLFSIIVIFILFIFILIKKKKSKLLNIKISLSYSVLLLIFYFVLFAPILTDFNPNYQNNIKQTRFLPPFTEVTIFKENDVKQNLSSLERSINNCVKNEINMDEVLIPFVKEKRVSFKIFINGNNYLISNGHEANGKLSVSKKIFLLGTDELGRDIFSRIIFGARVSLFISIVTIILSLIIGIVLGYIAANGNFTVNALLSRITDAFLSIPVIFFVIMILAFWGNSIIGVITVLSLTGWMSIFKIVKIETIAIKEKDYFITSKKLGMSRVSLFVKEVLPGLAVPLSVALIFQFSNIILAESALSFLGLGVGINFPSWGNLISSGQKYMDSAWWLLLFPSLALIIILLALNSAGEQIKNKINPLLNIE